MQFEAKTYKNQRKGFAEVPNNFHYKFADQKSRQDLILPWLINKKISKENFFFQNPCQANFPCLYPLKISENLNF